MFLGQHYNYPSPTKTTSVSLKEKETHGNLDLGILPPFPEPQAMIEPFSNQIAQHKSISQETLSIPVQDPLEDILFESQAQIRKYKVQLPSQQSSTQTEINATEKQTFPQLILSHSPEKTGNSHNINYVSNTNDGSDYPKIHLQKNSPIPMIGPRRLSFGQIASKTPVSETLEENVANKTNTDPLACHAENIMRMAMDSTMLGSFCNETISSSFSNILDESFLAKLEEKSFSEESEGGNKQKNNLLAFLKATKIDISAQDLEMAINDPLRLG